MQNYCLKREIISINKVDYRICSLQDTQQFDQEDQEAIIMGLTGANWSLFGVVWPAARILAAEVGHLRLDGKRVLELGCGIGLASIVLHRLGADITASDYHPRAKEFLDRNVSDNGLPPLRFHTVDFEKENPTLGRFDLIIASDVLYQPQHAECLSRLIAEHASNDAEVIVVDPGRANRAQFTRQMIALGFLHHYVHFNQQLTAQIHCKGRILHYRRRIKEKGGIPVGETEGRTKKRAAGIQRPSELPGRKAVQVTR